MKLFWCDIMVWFHAYLLLTHQTTNILVYLELGLYISVRHTAKYPIDRIDAIYIIYAPPDRIDNFVKHTCKLN